MSPPGRPKGEDLSAQHEGTPVGVFVEVVGRGPNLTLLHGWGLNGAVWAGIREALAARFTLHLIDLPGHGRSQSVPVTDLAALVEAVAGAMPPRGHLLGWSLGGHIALALAQKFPLRVERLITVGSTPRFVAAADWPHGKRVEVLAGFAQRLTSNYGATIRNFLALQALGQADMRDQVRTLYEAVNAHGAPSATCLSAALEILNVSDIRTLIPLIETPTLVIQGDHDALTASAVAQWLVLHLPNSRYCLMAHAAHAPFLSHREAFIEQLLSFLES